VKRTYQGIYFDIDQDGIERPYGFRMEVEIDEKHSFNGTVWEDEFSGITGKHLSVKGFIDEDHISFVKQYPCLYEYDADGKIIIDESQLGHEVIYDGYWNEEYGNWSGEWEVECETEVFQFDKIKTSVFIGAFEMNMVE
jgi:hypothetical protein